VGLGLHTLQGLHASARAKSQEWGGEFFFSQERKEKKNLRHLSTLFSEKSVQSVQALQYPGYQPWGLRARGGFGVAHLAGFARLGEGKVPGEGSDFFFLARKKRKKKPETPLYPFL
jgi:hypothetical protein